MTAVQVVHEAEAQRQHPRLRLPFAVEVSGTRYEAVDLSVRGLGLAAVGRRFNPRERHRLTLSFPFEDFDMSMSVDGEVRHISPDRVGFCFTDLAPRQVSFLHYIINGYLNGQVIRAGDVLEVAARDGFIEQRRTDGGRAAPRRFARVRRTLGYAVLTAVGLSALAVVGISIAERTFVTEAAGTLSSRHAVVVRAPAAGLVRTLMVRPGTHVEHETVLAVVETALGASSIVRSPCDCVMSTLYASEGEHVSVNQALVGMTPDNAAQIARAQIPLEAARDVKPGDDVFVDFLDGRKSVSGTVETVRLTSIDPNSYAGRSFNTLPLAQVDVALAESLPVSDIGQPVALRISSLGRSLNAAAALIRE